MYILKLLIFLQLLFLVISNQNINPSPRTGPQDLLVTRYDCEENEQKTLHKYAINQVSQCETEPQAIETTDVIATLYSKARATTVTGYKFTATFSEKKVHCSQVSNGNKNRLDHESFYQSNIERLLHLNPDDCKNELLRLNITQNKNSQRKLVNFQVFPDSVHQSQLERHQGHIKLDEKYPYNGAHGRLTYDLHDKHWIPHIGINDPSNCKADTKNKGYQEIMFFDWKIQLEKIQLTRDLSDNTMIYQGIRLPCKNDQGYCDTNETRNFVDEYVLKPTLSWTSYYHFTNPLCLPLSNTHIDIERNTDMLYRLTTPLTARQFTYVGYKKSLKTHTAPRANEYTLEYYDHNIIRANQDQFLDDDRFANPQITEKFFIKTPYIFTLNIFDRKFDHIISEALTDTQAYESFKERFQIFSLTFHFLAPHERDLHCSHDIMLRTKQTHTYSYYRFIQNHFDLHTPSRQPHHRFQFINSKYTSPFFLNFTYCIKDTNLHGILRNYDPITQMYIFCPITKTFNAEESRPFLIPHEFVQPIEIPILEFIHNTKFNHKLYNLIQNTPYEFAVGTEELTTIKALQLLWPLLQTKNIIRILAKLLTTSELIHDIFPHGFFPDD